tara:strand:+ start:1623 stop:1793 length:171 start_codon:yes stop_codon:yes gene_type:complete
MGGQMQKKRQCDMRAKQGFGIEFQSRRKSHLTLLSTLGYSFHHYSQVLKVLYIFLA